MEIGGQKVHKVILLMISINFITMMFVLLAILKGETAGRLTPLRIAGKSDRI